jgi:hypothetical protein
MCNSFPASLDRLKGVVGCGDPSAFAGRRYGRGVVFGGLFGLRGLDFTFVEAPELVGFGTTFGLEPL